MAAFNLGRSKRQSSLISWESVFKTKKLQTVESLQSKRESDRARAKRRINIDMAFERYPFQDLFKSAVKLRTVWDGG